MDPKDIVEQGYDRIGEEYERWSTKGTDPARERYLKVLLEGLPKGAQVLDLGCGSGALATRRLSERFQITGVELSSRMVELAQHNIPTATFVRADMASVEFPAWLALSPGSLDLVRARRHRGRRPRRVHLGYPRVPRHDALGPCSLPT